MELGYSYMRLGKYKKAIKEITKAIEIDNNLTVAYYYRGNAYLNNRDYDKSIADFEKVLSIAPSYSDTEDKIAEAKKLKGQGFFFFKNISNTSYSDSYYCCSYSNYCTSSFKKVNEIVYYKNKGILKIEKS